MADGIFPSLVSRTRDANTASNVIFVQLADNAGNTVGITAGDLDVNITNTSLAVTVDFDYAVDSVAGATDVGALVLAVRDDVLTTLTPADGDYVQLRTDSTGALWVNSGATTAANIFVDDAAFTVAVSSVAAIGMLADETTPDSVNEGDIGIPRMTLDRKQLHVLVDSAVDSQRLTINASGEAEVSVQSHTLTNANAVPVSRTNAANSETNPIFVQTVKTAVSGEEVHDYDTSASVGADATDNHDYTVVGTTFFLTSVIFAASGNMKVEIQTGPVATLVTRAVGFLNGRQGDTRQINFDPAIEVPVASTGTVRVIRTNRQGASQDVYSTIVGYDV